MSFYSVKQEKVPKLEINESLELSSVTDSGSSETVSVDKLDAYISHRVNELLQNRSRTLVSSQSQISELLNSYFLSSESKLKEALNSINLKNSEIENLKNENKKLLNQVFTLESEILKNKEENSGLPMIKNELTRLLKEEFIKADQLNKEISKNERMSKELRLKNEELADISQELSLIKEENKKLREVKDQILIYYKKKIGDFKAKWREAAGKTKEIVEKMGESYEKRKAEKSEEVKIRRLGRSYGDEKMMGLGKVELKSMELERKYSSDKEITPRKGNEKSKISNVKVLESPYKIKEYRRNKSQTKDVQESTPNKSQFSTSPLHQIHRYQT